MLPVTRRRLRLSGGTDLSFVTAGEASKPAVLLLHGFPSSAQMFREVIPELSQTAYVIAPDLPGFGKSDVLPSISFRAFGQAIPRLLQQPVEKVDVRHTDGRSENTSTLEDQLQEGLEDTFPASDPPADVSTAIAGQTKSSNASSVGTRSHPPDAK